MTFNPMIPTLSITTGNMPPLQDTSVARLHQGADSVLHPTLPPRTARNTCPKNKSESPRLLQLSEWHDGILDDELPPDCIQYTIEWKVMVNKKVISRDTEEDVALTPSAYWPMTLKCKLEKLLEGKASYKGRVRSDDTAIVVSVNDRSQRDLMKRFDHFYIDWTTVEKQLLRWGALFLRCKRLRLSITFKFVEDDRLCRIISGRVEKRGRSSVTKRMLNE
ncbi:unnamed protein product [Penicillium salamii]|uniref:Uncharacterized protein n=1 Tax=Penicillium salamii TaxID=1612424 RepID=A0A9W4IDY7_9EURO|nr:unnamed protein product [Penicillium salamii]